MSTSHLKLVLLRHGESSWNLENRFTGWTDVDLSEKGLVEAAHAAHLLSEAGFAFDMAYTSVLKRAIRTLWIVLDKMDLMWIPVIRSYRLNERHYGSLQGLNKAEMVAKFGEKQVLEWRRSYSVRPPELSQSDPRFPGNDRRYADLPSEAIPTSESLADTVARFVPYWQTTISKEVLAGKQVLIAAHGNSLRALIKHLDNISEADIVGLNIPTGIPLVYELTSSLAPIRRYYLGDQEAVAKAQEAVKNQTQATKPSGA